MVNRIILTLFLLIGFSKAISSQDDTTKFKFEHNQFETLRGNLIAQVKTCIQYNQYDYLVFSLSNFVTINIHSGDSAKIIASILVLRRDAAQFIPKILEGKTNVGYTIYVSQSEDLKNNLLVEFYDGDGYNFVTILMGFDDYFKIFSIDVYK